MHPHKQILQVALISLFSLLLKLKFVQLFWKTDLKLFTFWIINFLNRLRWESCNGYTLKLFSYITRTSKTLKDPLDYTQQQLPPSLTNQIFSSLKSIQIMKSTTFHHICLNLIGTNICWSLLWVYWTVTVLWRGGELPRESTYLFRRVFWTWHLGACIINFCLEAFLWSHFYYYLCFSFGYSTSLYFLQVFCFEFRIIALFL